FDAASARTWVREVAEACRGRDRASLWPERALAPATELAAAADTAAGWRAIRIPAAAARALIDLGRQQAATPAATLAAAVGVRVARRTGRRAVVVWVPASLRGADRRDALGALTTMVAIAIDFSDDPSFLAVLERTSTAICRGWAAAGGVITVA